MKYFLTSIYIFSIIVSAFSQQLEVQGDAIIDGKVMSVTDPTEPQDAATKAYVDRLSNLMLEAGLNGVLEDIDGNVYKTIKIGNQVWMADNLKTTRYNDGTPITHEENSSDWIILNTPAYCWYDNDSLNSSGLLGALYNYYVVSDTNTLNVCPQSWHVPSDSSWTVLTDYIEDNGYGYNGEGAGPAKSIASRYGYKSSPVSAAIGNELGANNSSGFNGQAGGNRNIQGIFNGSGLGGFFWCSGVVNGKLWSRTLGFSGSAIIRDDFSEIYGLSVRCLQD